MTNVTEHATGDRAERELFDRVNALGAFARPREAAAAIEATIEALGAVLVASERRSVSQYVPAALRGRFESPAHLPDLDLPGFYARVRRHERVPEGRAAEHAQIVCRALAELLPDEVVTLLRRHLPRLSSLFEAPASSPPPDTPDSVQREPDELATRDQSSLSGGRPGSRHPLSDARPTAGQAHSVARSDEPHSDTKLSSAHGLTQERQHESLSTGRPGPRRR